MDELTILSNGTAQILWNNITIVIHNDKNAYSFEEFELLRKAYDSLEEKAQGGTLSLEETAIRVAFMRYKQEENFKIYQTPAKAAGKKGKKKETSLDDLFENLSGEVVEKSKRTRKKKEEVTPLRQQQIKAARLLALQEKGEILSKEDEEFLLSMITTDDLEVL